MRGLKKNNRLHEEVGIDLVSRYQEIMTKIRAQLDPREIAMVKGSAQ